jgi:hypothetical protein
VEMAYPSLLTIYNIIIISMDTKFGVSNLQAPRNLCHWFFALKGRF